MSRIEEQLASLGRHLEIDWSDKRAQEVETQLLRRYRRRVGLKRSAQAMLVLLAAGTTLFALRHRGHTPAALEFSDGSRVERMGHEAAVRTVTQSERLTVVALDRGKAQFKIKHNPERLFRVQVGAVAIEDLGTDFVVERRIGGVAVRVLEGRVRIHAPGKERELAAGMDDLFSETQVAESPPPLDPAPAAATQVAAQENTLSAARKSGAPPARSARSSLGAKAEPAPAAEAQPSPQPAAVAVAPEAPKAEAPSWQELARAGDFQSAYQALRQDQSALHDRPAELLLAADVARLSGHPAEAVDPLERLLRDHSGDLRAPLGAFTLGRLLLDELHRPAEAAHAFARAGELDPDGPLSEDALAREVEAWAKSGATNLAHQRAEQYLARYPNGHRTALVKKFGHE